MAVEAQYRSDLHLFYRNVQEGKIRLGNNKDCVFGSFADQSNMNFISNGVGINQRKRNREVSDALPRTTTNMNSFSFSLQNQQQQNHQIIDLSKGLRLLCGDQIQQHQQQQILQQEQKQQPSVFSLFSEELSFQSKQQSDELDYFLHSQAEQLRRTLVEKRQQHYRALIIAAEETTARRLREKEAEVEKAVFRNAELEAKAAQLGLEAQSWKNKAHAQEVQATSLQAQLQHVISVGPSGIVGERETVGLGCAGEAEDNESAYVDPVSEIRVNSPSCKVCQKRVASVVLLPCRHLCVCTECNDVVQACPLCLSYRTAGVEVYLT